MPVIEKTKLEFREGSSDKVYIATVMQYDDGHQVIFEYGKRNNVNNRIVKPSSPVSVQEALAIYYETINKKLKKGYVPLTR